MTFVPEEEREKVVVSRHVPSEGPWEKGVPAKGGGWAAGGPGSRGRCGEETETMGPHRAVEAARTAGPDSAALGPEKEELSRGRDGT